jgi:hypothetical protein
VERFIPSEPFQPPQECTNRKLCALIGGCAQLLPAVTLFNELVSPFGDKQKQARELEQMISGGSVTCSQASEAIADMRNWLDQNP